MDIYESNCQHDTKKGKFIDLIKRDNINTRKASYTILLNCAHKSKAVNQFNQALFHTRTFKPPESNDTQMTHQTKSC